MPSSARTSLQGVSLSQLPRRWGQTSSHPPLFLYGVFSNSSSLQADLSIIRNFCPQSLFSKLQIPVWRQLQCSGGARFSPLGVSSHGDTSPKAEHAAKASQTSAHQPSKPFPLSMILNILTDRLVFCMAFPILGIIPCPNSPLVSSHTTRCPVRAPWAPATAHTSLHGLASVMFLHEPCPPLTSVLPRPSSP